MTKPLLWLIGSSTVATVLWLGVTVPVHGGHQERGCAILPPYESPDPPGFNSANGDIDRKGGFYPYYSPLVPISVRWGYKQVIPYYPGYCRHGKHGASGCPGAHDGAPSGPMVEPTGGRFDYGAFSGGAGQDDTRFWRMGGNGLVPYGTPQPPRSTPDLIDMIQGQRVGH
jgi:hypothetical protein